MTNRTDSTIDDLKPGTTPGSAASGGGTATFGAVATSQGQETVSGRKGIAWFLIAQILLMQIAAILVAEFVLYQAGLGEEEIFKLDPVVGFVHMPNKRVTWRTEGYARSYFDANGMREPGLTVAKPAGTYRIALLGDSMVEGLQVPIEDTFGQELTRRLTANCKHPVQVLNFATSGYSTAQQCLQLERYIFRYQPDLVLLCYNSRDMFENWTPPDQVITNVRPFAVQLPDKPLVVDNAPVLAWQRTPRAKFLQSIEWLRNNSRVYGMLAALELEMSMHNQTYKIIQLLFTKPKRAFKEAAAAIQSSWSAKPAFDIKFFETTSAQQHPAAKSQSEAKAQEQNRNISSAASNLQLSRNEVVAKQAKEPDGIRIYRELVTRTMGSLVTRMQADCASHGAQLAVATVPVRSALCPNIGLDTKFCNIDYQGEIAILEKICADRHLQFIDCEKMAAALSLDRIGTFYHSVHFKKEGHTFMADCLEEPLRQNVTH